MKDKEEPKDNEKDKKDPIKIILADDDKDDQHLFKEALEHTYIPTELTTKNNGQDLMDALHDPTIPNPDVIFLDINMPGKNGKECLEEIKEDEELKDIPTVMYTTSTSEQDINETYQKGANLYVPKPYSFSSIITILKSIFTLKWKQLFTKPDKKDFVLSEETVNVKKH
ncbi:MAG: response regulator [Bacteroidetes bacterium]|nr:response regulator [Bacteroidota bacterium]